MLKMIKYELLGSYRQFFVSFLVFLGLCFIIPWMPDSIFLQVGTFGVSTLMLIMIGMLFYNAISYYQRTMFKRQGYLTLTLPVSPYALVGAKVISTLIWLVLGIFVLVVGFMVFVMILGEIELSMIIRVFKDFFANWSYFYTDLFKGLGLFLSNSTLSVVYIFGIITFVHTHWFKKHRALWGIMIYFLGNFGYNYVLSQINLDTTVLFCVVPLVLSAIVFYALVYLLKYHIEVE